MAMVCRRGGVDSKQIGAIHVDRRFSLVEVAADVAEDFARAAGKPDPRDPRVTIHQDRGPRPEHRGPRPEHRGPRPEHRGPRPEHRGPRPEHRGPRGEGDAPPPPRRQVRSPAPDRPARSRPGHARPRRD
jgi:hypothetical protein